jgi:hypothetical protein
MVFRPATSCRSLVVAVPSAVISWRARSVALICPHAESDCSAGFLTGVARSAAESRSMYQLKLRYVAQGSRFRSGSTLAV